MSADATQNGQITAEPPRCPTRKERQAITDACRDRLALGARDGEVKRGVAAEFGISPRTVERYLRRARDAMAEETGRSRTELRGDASEVYRRILRDPDATNMEIIKAQERIDKLFGLESPQQIEHAGKDGGPLTFAAILAAAQHSEPPGEERTNNVVDVDAAVAKIEAEHRSDYAG